MNTLQHISGKEIAVAIGKSPAAISYLKKNHEDEYLLLKLGVLCQKLKLDAEDLLVIFALKQMELKKVSAAFQMNQLARDENLTTIGA